MKTLIRLLLVVPVNIILVQAADMSPPPKELRAEWKELQKVKFSDWTIKTFHGWDMYADGGSKGFLFETNTGERFDLMIANADYWTQEDKEARRQVFFVIYKDPVLPHRSKERRREEHDREADQRSRTTYGRWQQGPKTFNRPSEASGIPRTSLQTQRLTSHDAPIGHKLFKFISLPFNCAGGRTSSVCARNEPLDEPIDRLTAD